MAPFSSHHYLTCNNSHNDDDAKKQAVHQASIGRHIADDALCFESTELKELQQYNWFR